MSRVQKLWFLHFVVVLLLTGYHSSGQSKYAMVIGNSSYDYVETLKNAGNDAQDIASMLTLMDFKVDLFIDLNHVGMKHAIAEFGKNVKDYDIILFYYAGHGLELSGKNYFVPTDALASSITEVKRTCVSAGSITQILRFSKNKNNIVILDACRQNPFTLLPSDQSNDGLALMDAPPGTIISFATAPGQVAFDGEGSNGVYTSALLEYLPAFDVEIKDVFTNVRNSVVLKTNKVQLPWESTSLTQEVILRPKPELPIQIHVLENDSVTFTGDGELHARSNLKGVQFHWYFEGRQFDHGQAIKVLKSGKYQVKGISKAGQVIISEPIHVRVKSFVEPKSWIQEGTSASIGYYQIIHGMSNVRGDYRWFKDNQEIGRGSELRVEESGSYVFQVVSEEGIQAKSQPITIKIK